MTKLFGADSSAGYLRSDSSKADNGGGVIIFPLSQTRQLENKLNGARDPRYSPLRLRGITLDQVE